MKAEYKEGPEARENFEQLAKTYVLGTPHPTLRTHWLVNDGLAWAQAGYAFIAY